MAGETAAPSPAPAPPVAAAVIGGLRMLGNLAEPPAEVTSGALEGALRHELDRIRSRLPASSERPGAEHRVAPAVAAACAHLATAAYEDAYLALLTARGLL